MSKNAQRESLTAENRPEKSRIPEFVARGSFVAVLMFLTLAAVYSILAFRSNRGRVANLYLAKAKTLMRHDQFDGAADALEKARLADPGNLQAQTEQLKTKVFLITKQFDPPNRILDLEKLDNAEAECKSLLSADPGSAELTALLGIVYAYKDQPTLAIETYKKAIEMNPGYANVRNYWGYSIVQWRFPDNWQEVAAQKFLEARQLDSTYATPLINLALLQVLQGNSEAAASMLSKAEELGKNNEILYTLWGVALDNWGKKLLLIDKVEAYKKFSEALEKYRIAEALNPDLAVIHFDKANALDDLGRSDAAIDEYTKTIELEPGLALAYVGLAEVLINRKGSELQDKERALAYLSKAIGISGQTIEQYKYRKTKTEDVQAQKTLDRWMILKEKEKADFEEEMQQVRKELAPASRSGKGGIDQRK